jgi:hypothetical protein
MASTALPYLGSETPGARSGPKTQYVPLPFIAGISSRIGPPIVSEKPEKPVQDWAWSEFLTHQGADL